MSSNIAFMLRSIALLSVVALVSCRNVSNTRPGDSATNQPDVVEELPLPEVPQILQEPNLRADYVVEHFWDAMDFCDTIKSHDSDFMEQNFANYINIFPIADVASQKMAVEILMHKAEADTTAYLLLMSIAEKYLYEPNSPMLSEELYILFLEEFVKSPILGEAGKLRPRYQLETANKNRPGMKAADFKYMSRAGVTSTLYNTNSAGNILLIFYDPDCDHCKEILTNLRQNPLLSEMIANKQITVLAVHSGDQKELWHKTADELPAEWNVGYESGEMQENGSYVLRAAPTLYLLDRNKNVILKDVLPEQFLEYLSEM